MADTSRLEEALVNAHNAGDTAAATAIAQEIRRVQSAQPSAPVNTQAKLNAIEPPNWFERQLAKLPDLVSPKTESQMMGFVRGAAAPSVGAFQLAVNAADAVSPQETKLSDLVTGKKPSLAEQVNNAVAKKKQEYEAQKASVGRDGFDAFEFAGGMASPANLLVASKLPAATTALQRGGQGFGMGLFGGATAPVENGGGEYWKDKAIQSASGAALGSVLNPVAGAASDKFAKWSGLSKQTPLSPKDQTLKDAIEAGYVVPPSTVEPTFSNQVKESIAGKIATAQDASIRNRATTDALARKSVGLDADADLTSANMQAVRNNAYQSGYEPIKQIGQIKTDKTFLSDLDGITSQYTGKGTIPAIEKKDISDLVNAHRSAGFDSSDALSAIQVLRKDASSAFAKGENALGMANKALADAYENMIERSLPKGSEMLSNFLDARKLMAKTHTVENAIREGGGTVDARKIAQELQKGAPLSGELSTIGRFANNFPKANTPVEQIGSGGVSKAAAALSSLLAGGGASVAGPYGMMAGAVPFVVPPLVRSRLLSEGVQKGLIPDGRSLTPDQSKLLAGILGGLSASTGGVGGASLAATGQ